MKIRRWFRNVVLGLGMVPMVGTSVLAAENVTLSYGLFELSVSVSSLEAYAYENRVDERLEFYLDFLSEEERANFREILTTPLEVTPVTLSQVLYDPLGELWLQRLGNVIQTQSRLNGAKGLRGALILSAGDEAGLTLLNVMRRFPTPTLRIDSVEVLNVINTVIDLVEDTEVAIAAIQTQAKAEAADPIDFSQQPDPTQPGPLSWQTVSWQLQDTRRDRALPVDLYLPESSGPVPLVVISHGFAASRKNFVDMAQHLASYGIAVAAIEHPGSNLQQVENLLSGNVSAAMAPNEFIDRPRDISFLLDYIETQNQGALANQFDLNRIGVMGHSFGGYTALALAGAQINIDELVSRCGDELDDSVNVSLPLQCLALQSQVIEPLQDPRIRAAFVFNPITSVVFGQAGLSQIEAPVLLVSGSNDPVAPALPEQIRPFTWLSSVDKYLVLIQGGRHNYDQTETLPDELSGPDPALSRTYLKTLGLAFMQTHLGQQPTYQQFLQSDYAQHLSQAPLPLTLVETLALATAEPEPQ